MAPTSRRWTTADQRKFGKPGAQQKKGAFHKFGYFFAHKSYVTSAKLVADLIEERHYVIQARVTPLTGTATYRAEYNDEGWLDLLTWEMSQFMRSSQTSVMRRMYDVRHGKAKVCQITFAEAVCEALGMNMEIETNIPTLPGNKILAADLVAIRAENQGIYLDDCDLAKYAEQAWRLSAIIVRNPSRLERVQDMAPFDCLRNPR